MLRRDEKAESWNPASCYDSFLTTPVTRWAKSGPRSYRKLPYLHRVVSFRDTPSHPRLVLQSKVEEVRAAEFPLQLGVCVALTEDLSSIPSTHTKVAGSHPWSGSGSGVDTSMHIICLGALLWLCSAGYNRWDGLFGFPKACRRTWHLPCEQRTQLWVLNAHLLFLTSHPKLPH